MAVWRGRPADPAAGVASTVAIAYRMEMKTRDKHLQDRGLGT